jgi:hypothetical protein
VQNVAKNIDKPTKKAIKFYQINNMIKEGIWVNFEGKKKKCFGIHHNDNILIKMDGNLVQVNKDKVTLWQK